LEVQREVPHMKLPGSAKDPLWYKDAVIYETHVRSFFDANNDGIGDFRGLMQKLDYLQELGVTCLWLLPFFPSPLRDDGYDISDYTSVHPSYGTLDDFRAFLQEAHARNLQVIIELVINHTSDQHPWFQAARNAANGSPEREFYVWSDTNQKYEGARIIFTDSETSNWTWDPVANAYYWHRFFSHQPDLNYDNPKVLEAIFQAMRFWLDLGVDGLRLDAIPYLVEREGTNCENLPETHAVVKQLRSDLDARYSNRMFLAEANQWPTQVVDYFGQGDECHMTFHFPLMPRIFMALRLEDRHPLTEIMAQTPAIPETCQWAVFLRNHDELTLEMVTDEERDYMYFAYSTDRRMRLNIGIRRRLAPLMENNLRRMELLNSLLFSLPGTPILYYGDELGMGDNIYLGDRNGVRTPMQWSADRNGGFSRADPARLYSPVIMDPVYGYEAVNVEAQQSDPSSLLSWMRNMIALRKLFKVFSRGSVQFLRPVNRKILAYVRCYGEEQVLCVANLSRFAQPAALDLSSLAGATPVEMIGYTEFPVIGADSYPLTLGPYGFYWFELQRAATPEQNT
jgi:maltose alpha-D-glucosyltransferase/alpha-amylase